MAVGGKRLGELEVGGKGRLAAEESREGRTRVWSKDYDHLCISGWELHAIKSYSQN